MFYKAKQEVVLKNVLVISTIHGFNNILLNTYFSYSVYSMKL